MFHWLSNPYPFPSPSLKSFRTNTIISIFVPLFISIFQPFGLSEVQSENKYFIIWGYGLACFIATNFTTFVALAFINSKKTEENWNVAKEILLVIFVILMVSTANLVYSKLVGYGNFAIGNFVYAIFYTTLIGLFPVTLTVALRYQRLKYLREKESKEINKIIGDGHPKIEIITETVHSEKEIPPDEKKAEETTVSKILFTSENGNEKLEVSHGELLYIESADNYSQFFYLKDGKLKKEMLRGSLKFMETFIKNEMIVRCHRAFIVNLDNVTAATGNAQGYKLSFSSTDFLVPVSRNYIPKVLELFQSHKTA